ncbi:MAG: septal ring lytic transglycosylase RlpA family protein [Ketobacteraceae bacterium]|nr:septal ring lytic transglycosylase RlpA family protein [Ketobacteraceae bacterium]
MNSLQLAVTGLALTALLTLGGCAHRSPFEEKDGPPKLKKDISAVKNAVPRPEPKARYGNHSPYEVFGKTYHVMDSSKGYVEEGTASWYGEKFAGRFTSSMEPYDPYAMTAAHKSLPLPTYVRVTNLENGRSVIVRVNDRGPFHGTRIIDLSYAAAIKLGYANKGTARVKVEAIDPHRPATPKPVMADMPPTAESTDASLLASNSGSEQLYLQAGAFTQLTSAQRLQDQLQVLLNADISIKTEQSENIVIHRVFVGPFHNEQSAIAAQSVIRDTELANPLLVRR